MSLAKAPLLPRSRLLAPLGALVAGFRAGGTSDLSFEDAGERLAELIEPAAESMSAGAAGKPMRTDGAHICERGVVGSGGGVVPTLSIEVPIQGLGEDPEAIIGSGPCVEDPEPR